MDERRVPQDAEYWLALVHAPGLSPAGPAAYPVALAARPHRIPSQDPPRT